MRRIQEERRCRIRQWLFVCGVAFLQGLAGSPAAALAEQRVVLVPFSTGLQRPLDVAHAGGDRMYVAEREGLIRIVEADGTIREDSFLDIRDRVECCRGEQGLLGLAPHPDFERNGEIFVDYVDLSGDIAVSRFRVDPARPEKADPEGEEEVLRIVHQPWPNHNGGDLAFGPLDGHLYVSVGDGSSLSNAPNAQDRTSLLGKILRIDVDAAKPYAIPPDNPFVGDATALPEIWALGLRNPFRFSFDRSNGDLFLGDVGEAAREEIDLLRQGEGGANLGWPCWEGRDEFGLGDCPPSTSFVFPVHDYGRDAGCSVTGGVVYRGTRFPSLVGCYLFSDWCSGEVFSLHPDGTGGWVVDSLGVPIEGFRPTNFNEDAAGEVYVTSVLSDTLYRLELEGPAPTPTATPGQGDPPSSSGGGGCSVLPVRSGEAQLRSWMLGAVLFLGTMLRWCGGRLHSRSWLGRARGSHLACSDAGSQNGG